MDLPLHINFPLLNLTMQICDLNLLSAFAQYIFFNFKVVNTKCVIIW